jgi:hypothetical protein
VRLRHFAGRARLLAARVAGPLTLLALAVLAGCDEPRQRAQADSGTGDTTRSDTVTLALAETAGTGTVAPDTGVPTPIAATLSRSALGRRRPPALSPAADSVALRLTFVPRTQTWFIAATRGKRLLVDIGRADLDLARATPERRDAFLEAAARLSPLPLGARVRLRGPWGEEDGAIAGFEVLGGRIVASLTISRALDSLARVRIPLIGTALRLPDLPPADTLASDSAALAAAARVAAESAGVPSAAPESASAGARVTATPAVGVIVPATPVPAVPPAAVPAVAARPDSVAACSRDSVPAAMLSHAYVVRDSLEAELYSRDMPPYERMWSSVHVTTSQTPGCYGALGRLAVLVSLRASANEWVRERLVVLGDSGVVTPLRVTDYRFKGHDALYAFDADGDGVDDLAARAVAERAGGLVVLRMDVQNKRADRIAGGFAWETR